jgi:hypothetical protein
MFSVSFPILWAIDRDGWEFKEQDGEGTRCFAML